MFLIGFLAALGAALMFFLRSREIAQAESEKDQAETKLKEIEALNAVDEKFQGRTDDDIVLSAIDEQLRRPASGSKSDKGPR